MAYATAPRLSAFRGSSVGRSLSRIRFFAKKRFYSRKTTTPHGADAEVFERAEERAPLSWLVLSIKYFALIFTMFGQAFGANLIG